MKKLFIALLLSTPLILNATDTEVKTLALKQQIEAEPNNHDAILQLGFLYSHKAQTDEAAILEDAVEYFGKLVENDPSDSLSLAFYGSLCTMMAKDAPMRRKMGWLRTGVEHMDQAVESDPENPAVRLVRAINSYHLPGFFRRKSYAETDFAFLLQKFAENPDNFNRDFTVALHYHAGAFALKQNDKEALPLLRKAASIDKGGLLTEDIAQLLKEAEKRYARS